MNLRVLIVWDFSILNVSSKLSAYLFPFFTALTCTSVIFFLLKLETGFIEVHTTDMVYLYVVPATGDNSFQLISISQPDVTKMLIVVFSSAAVTHIDITPQEPLKSCTKAFAYCNDDAICLSELPGVQPNKYGWTQQLLDDSKPMQCKLYAGARQCNVNAATFIGYATISLDKGVSVSLIDGIDSSSTNFHNGPIELPTNKNGKFTAKPDKFGTNLGPSIE